VRVTVSLQDGVVHLAMRGDQAGTDDLLRSTLPELRAALVDAGLSAGDLGVGHDGQHGHAGERRAEDRTHAASDDTTHAADDEAEPALRKASP
jgi:hypothetical protein